MKKVEVILPEEVVPLAKCMRDFAEMLQGSLMDNKDFDSHCSDVISLMTSILIFQGAQEEQTSDLIEKSLKDCKLFFSNNIGLLHDKISDSRGIPNERKLEILAFIS